MSFQDLLDKYKKELDDFWHSRMNSIQLRLKINGELRYPPDMFKTQLEDPRVTKFINTYSNASDDFKAYRAHYFIKRELKIKYKSDKDVWNVADYWQTPQETMDKGTGDCEDQTFLWMKLMQLLEVPSYKCMALGGMVIGEGHCFVENTKVINSNGFEDIDMIQNGDKVLTEQGYSIVDYTFKRKYKGKLIKIYSSISPSPVICTPEHPIGVFNGFLKYRYGKINKIGNLEFKQAQNLKKGDFLYIPLDDSENQFYINKNIARLLGYYLGDGNLAFNYGKNGNIRSGKVRFALGYDKKGIKEDITRIIKEEFGSNKHIGVYHFKNQNSFQLVIYDTKLAKFILKYCGGANNKFISKELLFMKKEKQLELLRGIYLTDGYYDSSSGNIGEICSVYENLVFGIVFMLRRLRYKYSIRHSDRNILIGNKIRGRQIYGKRFYRISINNVDRDFNVIKNKVDRGLIWYDEKFAITKIKKIETQDYEGEVFNLGVNDTHTYNAEGFLVHNCYPTYFNGIRAVNMDLTYYTNCLMVGNRATFKIPSGRYLTMWWAFNWRGCYRYPYWLRPK
jgi:hypothetical protein